MRHFECETRTLLGLLAVGAILAVGAAAAGQERPAILRWATFPAGSLNHVMTSGMASVVDSHVKTSSRVASYTGYRDYVPLIDKSEADLGILNALDAWGAYHAKAPFYTEAHRNLRILRAAPAGKSSILVRANSPVKRVADLKGMKVAGGYDAHMVCRFLAESALAGSGLTWKDLTVLPTANAPSGVQLLLDGRVEAATCAAPGMPIVREADARVGVRWLAVETSPEALRRMREIFPGSFPDTLKPGEAPGVKDEVAVTGYHYYLTAPAAMREALGYEIARTLWEHTEELFRINPQLKFWTNDQAVQAAVAIPYHEGAIRFYKEKGLWKPELEKIQRDLLSAR